jgi:flagellar basal body-associated protein FliL
VTNEHDPDINNESKISNWVIPVVSTLSVVSVAVVVGISFWCCKKNKSADKKSVQTLKGKESNRPLILQTPPTANQRQSKFW